MSKYYGPEGGSKCSATLWKGDPKDSLAPKAQCRWTKGHNGTHQDYNGNNFDGSGKASYVVVADNRFKPKKRLASVKGGK